MSQYINWEELTTIEQVIANKITHNAIIGVNYGEKLIEVVTEKNENKTVYQCIMSCKNQKNVSLTECYSFDDNEIEQPCSWDKIETYCNNYLTNYGRD